MSELSIDREHLATTLEQLALLSSRGIDISDLLDGLAKQVRGTHHASPIGLVEWAVPDHREA